jgi:hypothetical protein
LLRAVADGVWTVDVAMRIAAMPLGARMTVLATPGGLLLHSPVPLDDAAAEAIAARGEVTAIVAPSLFHYRHVPEAKARFPRARVLGAPGLRAKRPALPIDEELGAPLPGLAQHLVGGMPTVNEVAFLHEASRTLVVTDLVFHFPATESWLLRLYLRSRAPVMSPLVRAMVKDRAAFRASRDALLSWEPRALVMSHGAVLEGGAREALQAALARV